MEKNTDTITEGNNSETNEDKSVPACCRGCVRWQKFGRNCYYYWEGKKHCTMWAASWDEVVQQQ